MFAYVIENELFPDVQAIKQLAAEMYQVIQDSLSEPDVIAGTNGYFHAGDFLLKKEKLDEALEVLSEGHGVCPTSAVSSTYI